MFFKTLFRQIQFGIILFSPALSYSQQDFKKPYLRLMEAQKEYKIAVQSGDSVEIGEMSYRLGKRYIGINNFFEALRWFHRSLEIRKKRGTVEDIAKLYNIMSECEMYQGNLEQYREFAVKSIYYHRKNGTKKSLMLATRANAGLLGRKYNPEVPGTKQYLHASIAELEKCLQLAEDLKPPTDVALCNELLGHSWLLGNETGKAIYYFDKANELYKKEGLWANVLAIEIAVAEYFLNKGNTKEAGKWLLVADEALRDLDAPRTLGQAYRLDKAYATYYAKIGAWQKAFEREQRCARFVVDERDAYRQGAMEGLHAIHEAEKGELDLLYQGKQLQTLRERNEYHQKFIIGIAIGLVLCAAAGLLYFRLFRRYRNLNEQNKLLVREQSHRVHNNLQSIADLFDLHLSELSDPTTINILNESLSRVESISLIHKHLYRRTYLDVIEMKTFIPQLVEQVLISQNCAFVQTRYSIQDILMDVDQATTLALIVNELVTNSCKYAFRNSATPLLVMKLSVAATSVQFEIDDFGPGFRRAENRRTFGLKIIELLTQKLKAKSQFLNGGSLFTISFPASRKTIDSISRKNTGSTYV